MTLGTCKNLEKTLYGPPFSPSFFPGSQLSRTPTLWLTHLLHGFSFPVRRGSTRSAETEDFSLEYQRPAWMAQAPIIPARMFSISETTGRLILKHRDKFLGPISFHRCKYISLGGIL